jgi:hypothetical protein
MVQRLAEGAKVSRIDESMFRITAALIEGQPLGAALASADASTGAAALADHLAAWRFVGFQISPEPMQVLTTEITA